MTKLLYVLVLAGLATAMLPMMVQASDSSPQIWQELPVPPVPPAKQPGGTTNGYQPAPIPNPDAQPPRSPATSSADPSLSPGLFMPPDRFAGDGYTPGSTIQGEQEKRLRPGAGFNLRLPFE